MASVWFGVGAAVGLVVVCAARPVTPSTQIRIDLIATGEKPAAGGR